MQNAGQQYGQGGASSHQAAPFGSHSETTTTGGSITSSLRQFRRKNEDKQSHNDNNTTSTTTESHVARVAPHSHYPPRPTNPDCYPYPYHSQYSEYGIQQPVKYSEISEPPQLQDHALPSVIQKPKSKEYLEMCNVQQQHMKPSYDHLNGQQTYPEANVHPHAEYINKDPQVVHHGYKPESQYYPKDPQYPPQLPPQMSKYPQMPPSQVRKYPPENDFLSKLRRINPTMARSIMNNHHHQESQPPYQPMDQNRMYPHFQNQRYMNYPSGMQNSGYSPGYMPYPNYPASCSYNRSPQMAARFPPVNPHERSISPRRGYPENMGMHMNYGGMNPQKISPNYPQYNTPEYAQHYQHRRGTMPPEYYQQHCRPTQYLPHQMAPQEMSENRVTVSDSIKHYIENWADEETASEMNQMENSRIPKDGIRGREDQPTETVYMINASELQYLDNDIPLVTSENGVPLPVVASESGQYIIKGGVSIVNGQEMMRIVEKTSQVEIDSNGERVVNLHIMDTEKPDCMLASKPNELMQRLPNEATYPMADKPRVVVHQNTVIASGIAKSIPPKESIVETEEVVKVGTSLPIISDTLEEELNRTIIKECRKETADKNCSPISLDQLEQYREQEESCQKSSENSLVEEIASIQLPVSPKNSPFADAHLINQDLKTENKELQTSSVEEDDDPHKHIDTLLEDTINKSEAIDNLTVEDHLSENIKTQIKTEPVKREYPHISKEEKAEYSETDQDSISNDTLNEEFKYTPKKEEPEENNRSDDLNHVQTTLKTEVTDSGNSQKDVKKEPVLNRETCTSKEEICNKAQETAPPTAEINFDEKEDKLSQKLKTLPRRTKRIFSVDDIMNNIGKKLKQTDNDNTSRRYSLQNTKEFLEKEIKNTSHLFTEFNKRKKHIPRKKSDEKIKDRPSTSKEKAPSPSVAETKLTDNGNNFKNVSVTHDDKNDYDCQEMQKERESEKLTETAEVLVKPTHSESSPTGDNPNKTLVEVSDEPNQIKIPNKELSDEPNQIKIPNEELSDETKVEETRNNLQITDNIKTHEHAEIEKLSKETEELVEEIKDEQKILPPSPNVDIIIKDASDKEKISSQETSTTCQKENSLLEEENNALEKEKRVLEEEKIILGEDKCGAEEVNSVVEEEKIIPGEDKSGSKEVNIVVEEKKIILKEDESGLKEDNGILEEANNVIEEEILFNSDPLIEAEVAFEALDDIPPEHDEMIAETQVSEGNNDEAIAESSQILLNSDNLSGDAPEITVESTDNAETVQPEMQIRNVIRVEESSVLLEIAGELVEINVNNINGKNTITVVPLSDTAVLDFNDNYETFDNAEAADPLRLDEVQEQPENLEIGDLVEEIPEAEVVETTSEIIIGMDLSLEEEIKLDVEQPPPVLCTKAAKKAYDCDLQIPSITTSDDVFDANKSNGYSSNDKVDKVSSTKEKSRSRKIKKKTKIVCSSASAEELPKRLAGKTDRKSLFKDLIAARNRKKLKQDTHKPEDDEFVPFKELVRARRLKKLKLLKMKSIEDPRVDSTIKIDESQKEAEVSMEQEKDDAEKKPEIKNIHSILKVASEDETVVNKAEEKEKPSDKTESLFSIENTDEPKVVKVKRVSFSDISQEIAPQEDKPVLEQIKSEEKAKEEIKIYKLEDPRLKRLNGVPRVVQTKKKLSLEEYNKRKRKLQDVIKHDKEETKKFKMERHNSVVELKTIPDKIKRTKSVDDNLLKPKEYLTKRKLSVEFSPVKQNNFDWEETQSPKMNLTSKDHDMKVNEFIGLLGEGKTKPKVLIDVNDFNLKPSPESSEDEILQNYKVQVESKLSTLNIQIPKFKPVDRQIVDPFTKTETNLLIDRFLKNEKLSPEEMEKIRKIISYKRLVQQLKKIKSPDLSSSPVNPSYEERKDHGERRTKLLMKKVRDKKKARFRNLYAQTDSESEDDFIRDNARRGDYSVVQANCLAGVVPKLIIKRKTEMPVPVVRLERLDLGRLDDNKKRYAV